MAPLCDARPGEGPSWAPSPAAYPGRRFGVDRAELRRGADLARFRALGVVCRGLAWAPCFDAFSCGFEGAWVYAGRKRGQGRGHAALGERDARRGGFAAGGGTGGGSRRRFFRPPFRGGVRGQAVLRATVHDVFFCRLFLKLSFIIIIT